MKIGNYTKKCYDMHAMWKLNWQSNSPIRRWSEICGDNKGLLKINENNYHDKTPKSSGIDLKNVFMKMWSLLSYSASHKIALRISTCNRHWWKMSFIQRIYSSIDPLHLIYGIVWVLIECYAFLYCTKLRVMIRRIVLYEHVFF